MPDQAAAAAKLAVFCQQQHKGSWQSSSRQEDKPSAVFGEFIDGAIEYAPTAGIDASRQLQGSPIGIAAYLGFNRT